MGQDYYRLSFLLCSLCSKSTVPQTIILPQPLDTPVEAYFQKLLDLVSHYQNHYPNPASTITKAIAALDLDYLKNDLPKLLGSMKRGTERIRKIVLSLRNFARMDESEYKAVNLHDGIESTLMILENRLKAQAHRPAIEIVRDYEDLPLVECYAGYLNQVFMNLLNNAIDALEEANQNKNCNCSTRREQGFQWV